MSGQTGLAPYCLSQFYPRDCSLRYFHRLLSPKACALSWALDQRSQRDARGATDIKVLIHIGRIEDGAVEPRLVDGDEFQ